MGKYYVFLVLLIVISLITGVIISIIEGRLKKEIEEEEDNLQTKTNLSICDASLSQDKFGPNETVTQFNTTFFGPPVITSVIEEKTESVVHDTRTIINKAKTDEFFDAPVLISSEFCEEILEDSEEEDII